MKNPPSHLGMQIHLFDPPEGGTNSLKEFLYYLKYKGIKGIVDFTYSYQDDSLHKHLTIKENFILDSIPKSLIKDNEVNLKDFMAGLKNNQLLLLLEDLGNLDQKINDLCPQFLKLTTLIKAILSRSEYVFLVEPEENLNQDQLTLLKQCIQHEAQSSQRVFFIKSKNCDTWLDVCTNIITKDEKLRYQDNSNPFNNHQTGNVLSFKKAA